MTTKLTKGTRYDLSTLTVTGWTGDDTGLDAWAYFRDGVYLGPDADGVEPLFAVEYPAPSDEPNITIRMDDRKITAATLADAMAIIRREYPQAVDITGDWADSGNGRETRQIVASDADDAPVVAELSRSTEAR